MAHPRLLLAASAAALSMAGAAHAGITTIQYDVSTRVAVTEPVALGLNDVRSGALTGVQTNVPTTVSASVVNGGGTANSTTTVSLGVLHSKTSDTFPLDGTNGDAQGFVDLNVADFGIAPTSQVFGSLNVSGFLSTQEPSGNSFSFATADFTILDLDNGNLSTNSIHMHYETISPLTDVTSGILDTAVGHRLELAYTFNIFAFQAGTASAQTAFADYSHTAKFNVDTGVHGTDFFSQTGFDYATHQAAAGVPESSAWTLVLAGFGLAGAAVRRRRPQAAWRSGHIA
jgi:hypothetical protein